MKKTTNLQDWPVRAVAGFGMLCNSWDVGRIHGKGVSANGLL